MKQREEKADLEAQGDKTYEILYTVKQVSSLIHTNPNYVYDLINHGLLPALKLGSYKVRREALYDFLEKYEGYDLSDISHITKLQQITASA